MERFVACEGSEPIWWRVVNIHAADINIACLCTVVVLPDVNTMNRHSRYTYLQWR